MVLLLRGLPTCLGLGLSGLSELLIYEKEYYGSDPSKVLDCSMASEVPWATLDAEDFNPISFVNGIFLSEEHLSEIDKVSKALREKISQLDVEMSEAVRRHSVSRTKGKEQLEKAHSSIDVCFPC